jgi:hypothetical protein
MKPTNLWLALTVASACAGFAHAAPARRVVVPIRQTVLKSGAIRYSVPVFIGHTRVEAMLDTGSTGIRVLPGTTKPGDFVATSEPASYSYSSGVKLTGVVANAMVAVGGLRGAQPIPVDDVKKVGCTSAKPHCAASHVSQQDYRLGGQGSKGFRAIIGVSLAPSNVVNPLPALGSPDWIIIFPETGDAQPGSLILNPNQEDLAGFTDFQLNMAKKPVQAIPACLKDLKSNQKVCGPTVLDTGTASVNVKMQSNGRGLRFRRGDAAQMSFTDRGGNLPPLDFTVRARGAGHVSVRVKPPPNGQPATSMNVGVLPYLTYDALYDSARSVIGLKPRSSGPEAASGEQGFPKSPAKIHARMQRARP